MSTPSRTTSASEAADYLAVPKWQRAWIAQHAQERAARTYLEFADKLLPVGSKFWEAGGLDVISVVRSALAGIEDACVTELAARYGTEIYLRHLGELCFTAGSGGRA